MGDDFRSVDADIEPFLAGIVVNNHEIIAVEEKAFHYCEMGLFGVSGVDF